MILALLAACTPTPTASGLDGTWVAEVAADPAAFSALVDPERPAWVALHAHAYLDVPPGQTAPGRRAAAELAQLDEVLAEVQETAVLTLAEGWATRSPDVPVPAWLSASALRLAELRADEAAAARWRPRAPSVPPGLFAVDQPRPARPARATPTTHPVLGTFWDPTLPRALRAPPAAAPDGLAGRLFGPLPGLVTFPATDDADACRAAAAALDAHIDGARLTGPDDGLALAADLQLLAVARARTLVDQGIAALRAGQPTCALYYASHAQDLSAPRAVTPVNAPALYATLAAANLRLGHVREALDALAVLRPDGPGGLSEVDGAFEAMADLAVQQGLSGAGVSRER